jgi:hypothetical protein
MIIETPYKQGDAITIKLTSGEELITRYEEDKPEGIKVSKPMSLTATQEGIGLAPFVFTIDPETPFVINNSAIVCVAKTEEQMATQYIQNTTGISM